MPPSPRELSWQIQSSTPGGSFEVLLRRWKKTYGRQAVEPLITLAQTRDRPETQRYVALMGAARLGGPATAGKIADFLHDPSWLLRSGALRALAAFRDPSTAAAVLPLLGDPSLAVRLDAVTAIIQLKPQGAAPALLQALASEDNYRAGKALWVPGRVLTALTALHAREAASRLAPLLDHDADPDLEIETIATLEKLTGRILNPGAPLSERVRLWKQALARL